MLYVSLKHLSEFNHYGDRNGWVKFLKSSCCGHHNDWM